MSRDNDDSYDDAHAQTVYEVASEAQRAERAAQEYIREHDIISALRLACGKLSEDRLRCSIPHTENTEAGTVVGFRVGRDGSVKARYKSTHGHGTRAVDQLNPRQLVEAVELVGSDQFGSAAEEEVRSTAKHFIEAGEAIPDDE